MISKLSNQQVKKLLHDTETSDKDFITVANDIIAVEKKAPKISPEKALEIFKSL